MHITRRITAAAADTDRGGVRHQPHPRRAEAGMKLLTILVGILVGLVALASPAQASEQSFLNELGSWTYDHYPADQWALKTGHKVCASLRTAGDEAAVSRVLASYNDSSASSNYYAQLVHPRRCLSPVPDEYAGLGML